MKCSITVHLLVRFGEFNVTCSIILYAVVNKQKLLSLSEGKLFKSRPQSQQI